jgi:ABC-type phosphate transport system auxiliary subunit
VPLRDEITELLRMPENGAGAPSLDAIESTLTHGYAEVHALEAERWRIERRLGEVARDVDDVSAHGVAAELAQLSRRLEAADGELARLRSLLRTLQARRKSVRGLRSGPDS